MLRIGGKNGGGVGQVLVAVAAALLFRLFTAPGPQLLPEYDADYAEDNDDDERNGDAGKEDAPVTGKVPPVHIKWTNITCSLSDKSKKSVISSFLRLILYTSYSFR